MAFRYSTAARNAAANAYVDLIDVGTAQTEGALRVYTGTQPATPATAASGTLLADFALPNPCFGAASSGVATANAISDVNGSATGTAGWCRVLDRDENALWDFAVGDSGVTFNTTSIESGVPVSVTSWTLTSPAS